ncbi:spore germination protein [Tumebacillus sp. ITR2]|uniref:Spore germination protein n=1 Tax=Tumebacillus amylolyticus TaxID=2801339 RepID=A0ABS1JER2_9BACL|nr:spore germination protein [Tumebacillus amylolyticus]MBL0388771.1 spore germination protein [Tumebacillus amylolyticus]
MRKSDYEQLKQTLRDGLAQSSDVEDREMTCGTLTARLLYLKTLCDPQKVQRFLIMPFWELRSEQEFGNFLLSFPDSSIGVHLSGVTDKLLDGYVAVFLGERLYLFEAALQSSSGVTEANVETVVQGPQDALTENLETSLNMLRARYQSPTLRVEMFTVGKQSKTKIALVYDRERAIEKQIEEIRHKLNTIDTDMLQAAGQLEKLLDPRKLHLFPTMLSTERPDRTVHNISKGKLALLTDKAGFALITPSIFSDFFSSMDDLYFQNVVGRFLLTLRYIGLALTLIMPSLYVVITSYNPEFVRVQLAFSIASSRAAVPYPSYLEVLFMLLMMEFLAEASIRLPRAIGPTATTVGGLILGQAATEAGLVSNIMIIIVSVVAISNFVIPINSMSFTIRVVKYPLLLLSTLFGFFGMMVGLMALAFYVSSITTLGTPYVKLFRKGDKS